jgi:HAD superfamily phosphoserine phosphatase-like hydrolase
MSVAFCFDLDGTLTREEILPQIARNVGLFEEIDILTNITMQGLITFDKSFKLRVKLLSTIPISVVQQTVSQISIDPHLQDFIRRNPDNCFIATGNLDVWVGDFIRNNYGCRAFTSIAESSGDQLGGVARILDKADAVRELKQRFNTVVTIGDGMNDCAMFELADKGIAFGGVHQPVSTLIQMSDYITYDARGLVRLLNSMNHHFA